MPLVYWNTQRAENLLGAGLITYLLYPTCSEMSIVLEGLYNETFCIKPANGKIRPAVQIASSLGIETKYTERDEIGGADGTTLTLNGKPCIFIARNLTTEEMRLTLTHELAHIVLGHLLSDDRFSFSYEQQEFEAETLGFILYNFLYGIDGGRIYRKVVHCQ